MKHGCGHQEVPRTRHETWVSQKYLTHISAIFCLDDGAVLRCVNDAQDVHHLVCEHVIQIADLPQLQQCVPGQLST